MGKGSLAESQGCQQRYWHGSSEVGGSAEARRLCGSCYGSKGAKGNKGYAIRLAGDLFKNSGGSGEGDVKMLV